MSLTPKALELAAECLGELEIWVEEFKAWHADPATADRPVDLKELANGLTALKRILEIGKHAHALNQLEGGQIDDVTTMDLDALRERLFGED